MPQNNALVRSEYADFDPSSNGHRVEDLSVSDGTAQVDTRLLERDALAQADPGAETETVAESVADTVAESVAEPSRGRDHQTDEITVGEPEADTQPIKMFTIHDSSTGRLASLRFHVDSEIPNSTSIVELVVSNGGDLSTPGNDTINLVHRSYKQPIVHRPYPTYDVQYIYDCLHEGILKDVSAYLVHPGDTQDFDDAIALARDAASAGGHVLDTVTLVDSAPRPLRVAEPEVQKPKKKEKNSFTVHEDEIILHWVRKMPHKRYSHAFYKELSSQIPRHTPQSIRDRYRKFLDKRLEYVYVPLPDTRHNLSEDDAFLKNEDGTFARQEKPTETLKRKFTEQDDYDLALYVNAHPNSPRSQNFFNNYAKTNPRHPGDSYRDRFRKHLSRRTIEQVIRDYEAKYNLPPTELHPPTVMPARRRGSYSIRPDNRDVLTVQQVQNGDTGGADLPHIPEEDLRQLEERAKRSVHELSVDDFDPEIAQSAVEQVTKADIYDKRSQFDPALTGFSPDEDKYVRPVKRVRKDIKPKEGSYGSNSEEHEEVAQHAAAAVAALNDVDLVNSGSEVISDELLNMDAIESASQDLNFTAYTPPVNFYESLRHYVSEAKRNNDISILYEGMTKGLGMPEDLYENLFNRIIGGIHLFEQLCHSFFEKGEYPTDVPGLWSLEDDRLLQDGNNEGILMRKHGEARVEARKNYLGIK